MRRISFLGMGLASMLLQAGAAAGAAELWKPPAAAKPAACRTEVLEGAVEAGKVYERPIGQGLSLLLQPIHSGWILRVVAGGTAPGQVGAPGYFDYAELATPPYNSVTPLSISTDFSFRSQDAVGWNPRRFRFATSAAEFAQLANAYGALSGAGGRAPAGAERDLAVQVAGAAEGLFTIVDSRLVPGTADQSGMAAAVSANFTTTAHIIDMPAAAQATPLGRIVSLRFRVELELPQGFRAERSLKIVPHLCGTR